MKYEKDLKMIGRELKGFLLVVMREKQLKMFYDLRKRWLFAFHDTGGHGQGCGGDRPEFTRKVIGIGLNDFNLVGIGVRKLKKK